MCIAIPVQVLDIGSGPMPMGHVSHNGTATPCCFAYTPEAQPGTWVIVQNGFAISTLTEAEAQDSLAAFARLAETQPHVK